ncbi:preprotein translocase subunit SecA [Candidatus Epulonipiscium fishelsonii]|uniref:Preprotein translocase subunit SecA n=1 Tax=Candidatus Epulonipiscium fishelsonii TaxID=77094 RepID=A0ACC8XAJ3_9FIRM|nr:preprotein translocase subunit SecA [Epulopiscium sp. SCG-B11WGA-EpuloA1]
MTLFEQWDNYGEDAKNRSTEEYKKVVEKYLTKERDIYAKLLSEPDFIEEGTIKDLSKKYNMTEAEFVGFVDGINDSLVAGPYDLADMTGEDSVKLEYDLKKLYWNMLDAKADWLFNLKQWENLLTTKERDAIKRDFNKSKTVVKFPKIGRNEPCSCGSGKKYKHCCMHK